MAGASRTAVNRLLGIDLGSVNVKVALRSGDRSGPVLVCLSSKGRPLEAVRRALERVPGLGRAGDGIRLGVTGGGRVLLPSDLPRWNVNEVVATARAVHESFPTARTVIDLGGQFSKWILLEIGCGRVGSVVDFATNGLCAAGSGAFIAQQAGRLDMSVDELSREAAGAPRGAAIAGRCSVFAKSDMIHLQQKGTPLDEIAFGLCQTLVRQFITMVMGGREIESPVVLVGGGAANEGLVRAFREALEFSGGELVAAENPLMMGALGAAASAIGGPETTVGQLLAALGAPEQPCRPDAQSVLAPLGGNGVPPRKSVAHSGEPSAVPVRRTDDETPRAFRRGATLRGPSRARSTGDAPPRRNPSVGDHSRAETAPDGIEGPVEVYLGVDVGSVSTNLVLLGTDLELVHGVYLPTRGRPVEVLDEGLSGIRRRFGDRVRVLAVGTTGSGRHLAARLLGADAVRNEITAQTVSATRFFPEVDTIFEIGGQDSKFVTVREGKLADFEMNKICAAGTGSFLEEQAARLGISIIDEFAENAFAGERPVDLGSRCTVFMDTELVRAQERGATVENLCAGLAYSVCRNYLDKVVAGRSLGRCIVFQGGTASNGAVVAAFRSLLGRPVRVHPYNRLSGALGAALLAARVRQTESSCSRFRGFDACARAELHSFECDACDNRCQVNRVSVADRIVHFGDVCERFSETDGKPVAAERPFPELFAERATLLEAHVARSRHRDGESGRPGMGLLRASLNLEYLPFWTAFLDALGYGPVPSPPTSAGLLREHPPGVPAELCMPVKAAASQARALMADGEAERLFVPALLECPRSEDRETHTCLYNQQLGDMLRVELGEGVVTAQFALDNGALGLVEPTLTLARALGRSPREVLAALAAARIVQAEFDAARKGLGARALAASFDRAAVILGKPYNTHDAFLNLSLARLLDRLGIPSIPWDLLPLDEVALDDRWRSVPWHFNRQQIRALEIIRKDSRLHPVVVSSYGCGPDAFVVKHLEEMLSGTPRLLLEFDEHRGEAGLLTRLEAFVDEIEAHRSDGEGRAARRLAVTPGSERHPRGRRFFLPNFSEYARIYAAVLRSAGWQAQVLPPADSDTVRLGEELASGRECHPYTILAGELGRLVQRGGLGVDDLFVSMSCVTSCLLRQYGDSFRIMCRRMGRPVEIWDANTSDFQGLVGIRGILGLYEGLLAIDILTILATRLRPYVRDRDAFSGILADRTARLVKATEARGDLASALGEAARSLWAFPREGQPGDRPVVGVTGDLYTRINALGNADLFHRLERMGCEVWPSPYFAQMTDIAAASDLPRMLRRVQPRGVLGRGLTMALTAASRRRLARALLPTVRSLTVEPTADRLLKQGTRYVGPGTNYLILLSVAKIADFLSRGASGVITAAGINCMVGTAVASAVPRIRADHGQAPVVTLLYGGAEGPAQRIRLETFIHQVMERWSGNRRDRGAMPPRGTAASPA